MSLTAETARCQPKRQIYVKELGGFRGPPKYLRFRVNSGGGRAKFVVAILAGR